MRFNLLQVVKMMAAGYVLFLFAYLILGEKLLTTFIL